MNDPVRTADRWWSQSLPDLWRDLAASESGLSTSEAKRRLGRYGPNRLESGPERSMLVQFMRRFRNPLVLILIAASAVSAAIGDLSSFVLISMIVLTSVTLDFIQEYRAGRAAQRLQQSVQIRAQVLRDGTTRQVSVSRVVPGDVVLLIAGSLIPADGRLLEARDLFVNQALLTGESFPVEKHAGNTPEAAPDPQNATHAVCMGTSVVSGIGRLLVCRTGSTTAVAQIAGALRNDPPPTAFDSGIRRFGMLIMRLTVLLVLLVLLFNAVLHRPLLDSLLFAVALAVGLTPELLPMVVSVTLAHGALRMARKQVIVKRLAAIQDLGAMNVLCTDKTGTLTEGKITLQRHVDPFGHESEAVLLLAYVNSRFETGIHSPLDDAILAHERLDATGWKKIDEVPFDFERRRVSVLVDDGATRRLIAKGAPEDLMRLSSHCEGPEGAGPEPWSIAARRAAEQQLATLADEGFRVLGIAYKDMPNEHRHALIGDETGLVFAGFAAFLDPPKPSAAKALRSLIASGVAVKIVTGDNERTTAYICRQLHLSMGRVLFGAEIASLSDTALQSLVETVDVFCRVNPAEKNRIVRALKSRGKVVGYLGDGVNDAPALHSADVGLSVDGAVDVAKDAATLILLRRDLQVLHEGILEGRRTFANIRKYIMMGTSSNFGNMLSMAGAVLFLPFLPMLPAQILLNNALYDFSELAIPLDRVDPGEVAAPQQWDMRFIRNFMWVLGPISTAFDYLTFYVLIAILEAGEALFQTAWFLESLATQVLVILVIRTRGNPLKSRPHPALLASSLAVLAVALVVALTRLGKPLGFVQPPAEFFAILAALIVAYLALVQAAKRLFYEQSAKAVHARSESVHNGAAAEASVGYETNQEPS